MLLSSTALTLLLASCKASAFGSVSKNNKSIRHVVSTSFTKKHTRPSLLPASIFVSSTSTNPTALSLLSKNQQATATCSASSMMLINTRGGSTSTGNLALNSAVSDQSSTESSAPVEYFRSDYKPLPQIVSKINMDFNIKDGLTVVTSDMIVEPNALNTDGGDLVLDGDETAVKLMALQINGRDLVEGIDYELKPGQLIIKESSLYGNGGEQSCTLKSVVEIIPEENTQLSGLYKSGPMYCSQCEAMGFRRITYFPDRPDNMAIFEKIRIEADKESYPVLLSNGNFIESGSVDDNDTNRHYAVWSGKKKLH